MHNGARTNKQHRIQKSEKNVCVMYATIIIERTESLIDGLVKTHPEYFKILIPYPNLDTGQMKGKNIKGKTRMLTE